LFIGEVTSYMYMQYLFCVLLTDILSYEHCIITETKDSETTYICLHAYNNLAIMRIRQLAVTVKVFCYLCFAIFAFLVTIVQFETLAAYFAFGEIMVIFLLWFVVIKVETSWTPAGIFFIGKPFTLLIQINGKTWQVTPHFEAKFPEIFKRS